MPVTRIEFGRIKGRGDGERKDNYETVLRVFRFCFSTQREREYEQDTDLPQRESTQVRWGGRDGRDETLVWVTHRTTGRGGHTMIGSIRTHSLSGQNSRWAANVEREVGQPSIGYLKRRLHTETVGGISHRSVPCLRPTGRIIRRLVLTFRRATQIGLRR